ncbi:LPS export ABC transporter permease LptF [bacterium]|nr:MAG: LPS export ABC transporter permease LptF [bacterium]
MPRLLNRYIFTEIAVPFGLSLVILNVTALLSKVMKLIDLMVTHGMGPSFVFWFIASIMPSFLIYTIPISFLVGVLVAFTRLSSDSEITAMKAGGVSLLSMMRPVMAMAGLAGLLSLACAAYLFPWGNLNIKKLLFESAKTKLISGIEEKTFYDKFKGAVIYVDHLSGGGAKDASGVMQGVFISDTSDKGEPAVFFAKQGEFESTDSELVYLKLSDGTLHKKSAKDDAYHIAKFSSYLLELKLPEGGPSPSMFNRPNRELYPLELLQKITVLKAGGKSTRSQVMELNKRFSLPASVLVFALISVPLGIQKIRTARLTGFSVSLGVVLIYYVLSTALETLGSNGVLNPAAAVWGSNIIFTAAGLYAVYRASKDRPIVPKFLNLSGKT